MSNSQHHDPMISLFSHIILILNEPVLALSYQMLTKLIARVGTNKFTWLWFEPTTFQLVLGRMSLLLRFQCHMIPALITTF